MDLDRIDKYTTIIDQNGCKNIINSRSIKFGEVSEHEQTCLDAYGKLYAKAMYMGASARWEVPVGCCEVIIVDEDGASLGSYR